MKKIEITEIAEQDAQGFNYECYSCGCKKEFYVKSPWLGTAPNPHAMYKELVAAEKGWKQLWFFGRNYVCPDCIAKLVRAFVPGVGIELVPKIMVEKGQAYLFEDVVGK